MMIIFNKILQFYYVEVMILVIAMIMQSEVMAREAKVEVSTLERSFSVEDAVEFSHIVNPNINNHSGKPEFIYSPDRKFMIYVTRRSDVSTNQLIHELWIVSNENILKYFKNNEKMNKYSKIILTWKNSSGLKLFGHVMREPLIHSFEWSSDGKSLYFIGKTDHDPDQLYSLNLETGDYYRLTNSTGPIIKYSMNREIGSVIYVALVPRQRDKSERTAFNVGANHIRDVFCRNCEQFERASATTKLVYKKSINSVEEVPIELPDGVSVPQFGANIWLSPNGGKAVAVLVPPANKTWPTYVGRPENPEWSRDSVKFEDAEKYTDGSFRRFLQFYIIDLESGEVKPAIDAPAWGIFAAQWSKDGNKVIFGPTFTPPGRADLGKLETLGKWTKIVEYDISNGNYDDVYEMIGDSMVPYDGISHEEPLFIDSDKFIISRRSPNGAIKPVTIFKKGDEWAVQEADFPSEDLGGLQYTVQQTLNRPPQIVAIYNNSERLSITSLNEKLNKKRMGFAQEIIWKDNTNSRWRGALIYPVDYVEGVKYPLVIQMRGYIPGEFIVSGYAGTTAPFAARPLASKGFMVLQMPVHPESEIFSSVGQTLNDSRRGIESAIKYLSLTGHIDRNKIGLIGWSYSGLPVINTLTFSDFEFRAAVVADAYGGGMSAYVNSFGYPPPSMHYLEHMYGDSKPWGKTLSTWIERNPVFHLDNLNTPILFQQYLFGGFAAWWDFYAVLRRMGKSAEMWQYPESDHVPIRPDQQLHAQNLTVDWFVHWLKGEKTKTSDNNHERLGGHKGK